MKMLNPSECQLTPLQVAAGYITFANMIQFLAVLGIVIFGATLFYHLREKFENVPTKVWKGLGYSVATVFCLSRFWLPLEYLTYAEFLGAIFTAFALYFVVQDCVEGTPYRRQKYQFWNLSVAVVGTVLAALQSNSLVAGVAVLGLMGFLGFVVFSSPRQLTLGFYSEDSLFKATLAALALLIPAVILKINFASIDFLNIFWPSLAWICTFVASVGLLISSSRFYENSNDSRLGYILRNILALIFGAFCIWAGSVHGFTEVQRIGGTFLLIWLFEKPWDIPQTGKIWYALVGTGTCVAVFFLMQEIAKNPEYYNKFLLF